MKLLAVAFLSVLSLAAGTSSAAAEPLVIKLATLAPEGSPWHNALRDLAERWKQISKGTLEIVIYGGGAIGDEPSVVQKMRIGQLQAAGLSGAGLHQIATEVQALQMPMMFRSDEELGCVRELIRPKLEGILEHKGFKMLTWSDAGWVYFFVKSPVVRPEDLKRKKLFVWAGDTSTVDAWKDFGAEPVPLPATEIYQGLQSGLIEAVPTTPIAALSYQWFPLAPHMTAVKWAPLVGGLVITTKAWQKIPESLRPALLAAAEKTGQQLQAQTPAFERDAIKVMQQHGLTVVPVPAAAVAGWERQARAGYESILDRLVPRAMVAEVERLRDGCRGR